MFVGRSLNVAKHIYPLACAPAASPMVMLVRGAGAESSKDTAVAAVKYRAVRDTATRAVVGVRSLHTGSLSPPRCAASEPGAPAAATAAATATAAVTATAAAAPLLLMSAAVHDSGNVLLRWSDGLETGVHPTWLRHNCKCTLCCEVSSGQKTIVLGTIKPRCNVATVTVTVAAMSPALDRTQASAAAAAAAAAARDDCSDGGSDVLEVVWADDGAGDGADGVGDVQHTSIIPASLLASAVHAPALEETKERGRQIKLQPDLNGAAASTALANGGATVALFGLTETVAAGSGSGWLPEMAYEEVCCSDEGLWQWLEFLRMEGACVLKDAPVEKGIAAGLANLIAYPQQTM